MAKTRAAAALSPTRESRPSADAPFPAGLEVDVALAEPELELAMCVASFEGVLVAIVTAEEEEEGTGTTTDEELLPPGVVPDEGGGTALEMSTRFPSPQGMGSLDPGCVGFAGGVVAPAAEAMVNRVVQVLTAVCPEEYW